MEPQYPFYYDSWSGRKVYHAYAPCDPIPVNRARHIQNLAYRYKGLKLARKVAKATQR